MAGFISGCTSCSLWNPNLCSLCASFLRHRPSCRCKCIVHQIVDTTSTEMYNRTVTSGKLIAGVRAAVGTPRDNEGGLDEHGLRTVLEFLINQGIKGFAINGATGEYALTTPDELSRMLAIAVEVTKDRADLICGIGSASLHGCLNLIKVAAAYEIKALLLPMPHFFPYAQTDLDAFCRAVAAKTDRPILLYNLPFSSPLAADTVVRLLKECPNIIGIKDSSGSLDILRQLTQQVPDACRIVGSDGVLEQALLEDCCDGVISGVASVLPELIFSLYNEKATPHNPMFIKAAASLTNYIDAIRHFPVPWGLKFTGEFLGILPASFSQPLSAERRAQAETLRMWVRNL